ncbi:regulatory protein, luxR family [Actinacidiphila alni]|uniref:Regulatory protein, luxR family n=1 Tax=Actinacidiphila alni TaxID=380248 RepID=A0A1I2I2G3_9ACTN|nr:regulatory protein, luxR family [Actinacidiphila alni]
MYGDKLLTDRQGLSRLDRGRGSGAALAPIERSALQTLTPREREVLSVMGFGEGNRALASRLGIAERTVKAHLTSITRKLGLRSRVETVLVSLEWAEDLRPAE